MSSRHPKGVRRSFFDEKLNLFGASFRLYGIKHQIDGKHLYYLSYFATFIILFQKLLVSLVTRRFVKDCSDLVPLVVPRSMSDEAIHFRAAPISSSELRPRRKIYTDSVASEESKVGKDFSTYMTWDP